MSFSHIGQSHIPHKHYSPHQRYQYEHPPPCSFYRGGGGLDIPQIGLCTSRICARPILLFSSILQKKNKERNILSLFLAFNISMYFFTSLFSIQFPLFIVSKNLILSISLKSIYRFSKRNISE